MRILILITCLFMSFSASASEDLAEDRPASRLLRDCAALLDGKISRLDFAQKILGMEDFASPAQMSGHPTELSFFNGKLQMAFVPIQRVYVFDRGMRSYEHPGHKVRFRLMLEPEQMLRLKIYLRKESKTADTSEKTRNELPALLWVPEVLKSLREKRRDLAVETITPTFLWGDGQPYIEVSFYLTRESTFPEPEDEKLQTLFFQELAKRQLNRFGLVDVPFAKPLTRRYKIDDLPTAIGVFKLKFDEEFFCFTGDMMVSTPHGPKAISEIQIGDQVNSFDEQTGQVVTNTVESIDMGEDRAFGRLEDHAIQVTSEHLFYAPETRDYRRIGEMHSAQKLQSVQENSSCLMERGPYSPDIGRGTVYNLHMQGEPHNYMVNGMVVHNIKR